MNGEFGELYTKVSLLILQSKEETTKVINDLASRLDKRINSVDNKIEVHNRDGLHNKENIDKNEKDIRDLEKKVEEHKDESKLKDKEHGTQLKIQWVVITMIIFCLFGMVFFILKKYI